MCAIVKYLCVSVRVSDSFIDKEAEMSRSGFVIVMLECIKDS